MFEYMASGKPIIASDLPVIREVLHNEENALLVSPDHLESWVMAVERLCEDFGLRKRLGEQARSDQLEYYTWGARASAILKGIESEKCQAFAHSSSTRA
jgi:glycosyltransferase involved in cell wall biosynthesis